MKTDELFYELFRLDPRSLFELVHLNLEGEYTFESITIKTTEKRLDGFIDLRHLTTLSHLGKKGAG